MFSSFGKKIAVTGGIGSGKSRVSGYWANFARLSLINVDQICADLLKKGNEGWQAIRNELDDLYFFPDGDIDRKRLRSALFADEGLRKQVNDLLHPLALERTMISVRQYTKQDVLVDVPLLFEAGWEDFFDHRVVVYAEAAVCCRRVVKRDNVSFAEAERILYSQLSMSEKIMCADHVVNNSGSWTATILEIIHLARVVARRNNEQQIITEIT